MNRLGALADAILDSEEPVRFWWRDDDAHRSDRRLDRLLSISERHTAPVSLAVVPAWFRPSLAQSLAGQVERVSCLLHGYAHENHAAPGARKSEYPENRNPESVASEIRRGHDTLRAALPEHYVPVFVPPWNRMAAVHYPALARARIQGFSARFNNTEASELHNLPIHLDIVDWQVNAFRGEADCIATLTQAIQYNPRIAIGIMTHHLDHDEACWRFLDALFSTLRDLENCQVLSIRALLNSPPCGRGHK